MHNYRELKIWQRGVDLATEIYQITQSFPPEEKFGLTLQIRKAAVSISSNISEGSGRNSDKEFRVFLGYAYGSLCEVDTQLRIAQNLTYVEPHEVEVLDAKIQELQKMIYAFRKGLSSS